MGGPKFKMGYVTLHARSRDGLSSMGWDCYAQPLYQIWNLYVYPLQRYERRRKIQKFGWFGWLGVTQGHQQHNHSISHIRLPILIETTHPSCTVFEL